MSFSTYLGALFLVVLSGCGSSQERPKETAHPVETADSHGETADSHVETGDSHSDTHETGSSPDTGTWPTGPLALTSPAEGDTWASGSLHYVTWTVDDQPRTVTVEQSRDAGKIWVPLLDESTDAPSTGLSVTPGVTSRVLWRVGPAQSTGVRLRVRDEADSTVFSGATIFQVESQEEEGYVWEEATSAGAFAPRDGAGALAFNDRMWLLGGWNPTDPVHFPEVTNSEIWSSTDGATWTLDLLQAPWEGRHTAGYLVHRDQMWILGGDPLRGHYQTDVWSTADGVTWNEITPQAPWGQRVLHYAAVLDDTMYVMGGQTLPQYAPEVREGIFYNDVWSSQDGVTWTQVQPDAPWPPRGMIGGSAVKDGRIWLLGGGTYDTPDCITRNYYNDVWSTADGVDWVRNVEYAPWEPRQYHNVATFDGKIWVLEGWDGGNRNDVWYSADGVNWYELRNTPWATRHASSIFVYDDSLWVVAGNNMTSDAWRLTKQKN